MPIVRKVKKGDNEAVSDYKKLMETYRIQNPVKWAKATTEKVFANGTLTEYEYKIKQLSKSSGVLEKEEEDKLNKPQA